MRAQPSGSALLPAVEERTRLLDTMQIHSEKRNFKDVITLQNGSGRKHLISARRGADGDLSLFTELPPANSHIAAQIVFGGCQFYEAAKRQMNGAEWPLLWVQGDVCNGAEVNGTQAIALQGHAMRQVRWRGNVVGSGWSDDYADYCLLAGVLPANTAASREEQTQSCLEQIEGALQAAGMEFSNIVRTWFYLDRLLDWYDEFNAARTRFFESHHVFDGLIPASTGIGAGNPAGAALAAGALAVRPHSNAVSIREVASPLQCPATEYRSSFSRAVEVADPSRRLLLASGTASIAPGGESLFADDFSKQIHLTLDVVEAILHSCGMDWQDTTRAVGYFRDMRALSVYEECCRQRGMAHFPMVAAHATVCRDDLLFEMELDAVALTEKATGEIR